MKKTVFQRHSNTIYAATRGVSTLLMLGAFAYSWYLEFNPPGADYPKSRAYAWLLYLTHWVLSLALVQQLWELNSARKAFSVAPEHRDRAVIESKNNNINTRARSLLTTQSVLVTGAFWGMAYAENIDGPPLGNLVQHGLPLATYVTDIVINGSPYADKTKKDYLINVGFMAFYLLVSFISAKAGATNEEGDHYQYAVLDWNSHLARALILSAGGLVALFAMQYVLNPALNFAKSFTHPYPMTAEEQPIADGAVERVPAQAQPTLWQVFRTRCQNHALVAPTPSINAA